MEPKPTKKQQNKLIGAKGEQITAKYLEKQGFTIVATNYLKKWGEIDIVAQKNNKVHFVEVKTVSYETKQQLESAVTHATWRPEENVHAFKIKKLSRAIETWISETRWPGDWQIDVAAVRLVPRETFATIKIIDNVIMD